MVVVSDDSRKNYAVRIEKLLIVSWNTIRLMDYPIAKFVDEQLGFTTPDDVIKLSIIDRSTQDFRYRGLSREAYYKAINIVYPDAYNSAPETLLYPILNSSVFKGVQEIVVAHNTFLDSVDVSGMIEEHTLNIEFNGTIEHLEELIIKYGSTGVIIDDIEYIKELIERNKIPLDGMSFIVPMIGYNFVNTKSGKVYKFKDIIDEAMEKIEFELAFADLFILSRDNLMAYLEEK